MIEAAQGLNGKAFNLQQMVKYALSRRISESLDMNTVVPSHSLYLLLMSSFPEFKEAMSTSQFYYDIQKHGQFSNDDFLRAATKHPELFQIISVGKSHLKEGSTAKIVLTEK